MMVVLVSFKKKFQNEPTGQRHCGYVWIVPKATRAHALTDQILAATERPSFVREKYWARVFGRPIIGFHLNIRADKVTMVNDLFSWFGGSNPKTACTTHHIRRLHVPNFSD